MECTMEDLIGIVLFNLVGWLLVIRFAFDQEV